MFLKFYPDMSQKNMYPIYFFCGTVAKGLVFLHLSYLIISVFPNLFNYLKNHRPVLPLKKVGLIVCLLFTFSQTIFSLTGHSTRNNYTGDWEVPASWIPLWDPPQLDSIDNNVTINGYISRNGSITFYGAADTLFVNDTLVIYGDLTIENNNVLIVNNNAILIVRGNLNAGNQAKVVSNGYIIATGNFTKSGVVNQGAFVSSNTPSKVFIGGSVRTGLDTLLFPVFKCPGSAPYDSSKCSYGNMADLSDDPIDSFFRSTCSPVSITSSNTSMCVNETRLLTGNPAGGLFTVNSGPGTVNADVLTAIDSGIIILKYTEPSRCFNSDSQSITINPLPIPIISITDISGTANNDGIICLGDSATLTASGGISFKWSSGDTVPAIIKGIAGIYTVTVTDANGCNNTAGTTIITNTLPVPAISITDNSGVSNNDGIICLGDSATLTASGGISFKWSSGDTVPAIIKGIAGTYAVTVTDANRCNNAAGTTIITNTLPVPAISITDNSGVSNNDGIICLGDSATLTASGGISFKWSSGDTVPAIIKGIAGTYAVTVTDANRCNNTAGTTIIINALPTPAISITDNSGVSNNDGIICAGETATLTASGGTSFNWSSGETVASIIKGIAGTYTVTITDANGCKNTADTTIIINALPTPAISITDNSGVSNNDGIFCFGDSATLTASGGVNFNWSSGEKVSSVTKDTAGTYTVTVTDVNGCKNTTNATISTIKTIADAGTCGDVCGQDYTLHARLNTGTGKWTVTSGEGNVTFIPDENDPSATIKISNYGTYQFTWTVVNENCPASSDVTVAFHEIPIANAGTDQELNNAFTSKMEAHISPSDTGEWTLLSGSGIIEDIHSPVSLVSGLSAGDNIFLWKVQSEGCSDSDTINIKVNNLFVPQIITPNGDGKNDFFVIKDIEKNSPANLIIFNRWGIEVYHNNNYLNNWDGKSNDGIELSNDTYFYILKFPDRKEVKGFIVIKK